MSVRRANNSRPDAPPQTDASEATEAPRTPAARTRKSPTPVPAHTPVVGPRSTEEAEEHYVAARDAWIVAMRKANSGRSADLATLGISQEAYVEAAAEVEKWRSGAKVAIPIEPETHVHDLETAVGQEFAWRRVLEQHDKPPGLLARAIRRLTGRG